MRTDIPRAEHLFTHGTVYRWFSLATCATHADEVGALGWKQEAGPWGISRYPPAICDVCAVGLEAAVRETEFPRNSKDQMLWSRVVCPDCSADPGIKCVGHQTGMVHAARKSLAFKSAVASGLLRADMKLRDVPFRHFRTWVAVVDRQHWVQRQGPSRVPEILSDLSAFTRTELRKIRHLGETGIFDIQDALAAIGLTIKPGQSRRPGKRTSLVQAARLVVSRWAGGDLAAAVRDLDKALHEYDGRRYEP